jgi:hypothetical protein
MNIGVVTVPCGVEKVATRARPLEDWMVKSNTENQRKEEARIARQVLSCEQERGKKKVKAPGSRF